MTRREIVTGLVFLRAFKYIVKDDPKVKTIDDAFDYMIKELHERLKKVQEKEGF